MPGLASLSHRQVNLRCFDGLLLEILLGLIVVKHSHDAQNPLDGGKAPQPPWNRMSYLLPHLDSGWAVDQAILTEEAKVVVIRFGRDADPVWCVWAGLPVSAP